MIKNDIDNAVVPEVTPLSSVSLYKNTNDLFNNKYSTLEQ